MLRRPPTRLELKLDDLSEYEQMKRSLEDKKKENAAKNNGAANNGAGPSSQAKSKVEMIHQRIGFDPSAKGNGGKP